MGPSFEVPAFRGKVGASVVDGRGIVISTGSNDAPCAGGGAYLESEPGVEAKPDGRCAYMDKSHCSNTEEQNQIIREIIEAIPELRVCDSLKRTDIEKALRSSPVSGLIEFSRAVHAEMDALLSAARRGVALADTRVFVTTFPCHSCARHLVSAGVDEVQFIEPYFKSKALTLHNDSITTDPENWKPPSEGGDKVLFHPHECMREHF